MYVLGGSFLGNLGGPQAPDPASHLRLLGSASTVVDAQPDQGAAGKGVHLDRGPGGNLASVKCG